MFSLFQMYSTFDKKPGILWKHSKLQIIIVTILDFSPFQIYLIIAVPLLCFYTQWTLTFSREKRDIHDGKFHFILNSLLLNYLVYLIISLISNKSYNKSPRLINFALFPFSKSWWSRWKPEIVSRKREFPLIYY